MCNFTPSSVNSRPDISPETARAFEDLRLGMAKYLGADPDDVELTICRPRPIKDEEFFFEQHDF